MNYRIYTSYFGNLKKLSEAGIVPISIALWNPKWYNGQRIIELAPSRFMLSDACTSEQYVQMYNQNLKNIYPRWLLEKIESIGKGKDVALLCYEKPGDFCHRHLFAEWFTEKTGIEIKEYEVPVEKKKPQYVEGSLFW